MDLLYFLRVVQEMEVVKNVGWMKMIGLYIPYPLMLSIV